MRSASNGTQRSRSVNLNIYLGTYPHLSLVRTRLGTLHNKCLWLPGVMLDSSKLPGDECPAFYGERAEYPESLACIMQSSAIQGPCVSEVESRQTNNIRG